ncbi:hypothetical protein ACIQZB_00385 [Streptomyces sp. NPDC097727]|uniref:hypothetical protein n=1 Tax=Streptomyces sp. NPDC097727 TaxID=3366092 RepID=UPI00380F5C05
MNTTDIQTPERFGGEPLYGNLPLDYRQRERPFTVTIADVGRYDSERPSTYVVDACSTEKAWVKALAWHMEAEESIDCYVLADESFEGLPDGAPGIEWSDLRPERKRQRDLDDLADKAAELVRQYKADGTGRVHEGAAWPMVRELAGLDGRTGEGR